MSEQDIIMNTLISLKHLVSFFSTYASEAGSKEVEKVVDKAQKDILKMQRQVFQFMVDKDWMKVQYQTKTNIDKVYKKYKNKSCEV